MPALIEVDGREEEMNGMDIEHVNQGEDETKSTAPNDANGTPTPDDQSEVRQGVIQAYKVKGPWGRILVDDGSDAWFNEEFSFVGGERLPEGERVEFKIRYQEKPKAWEAVAVRRQDKFEHVVEIEEVVEVVEITEVETTEVEITFDEPAAARLTGRVAWFDAVKGTGFIKPDGGGKDLHVRRVSIVDERYRNLVATERVEFEMMIEDKGPVAINVRSLMPEGRTRGVVKSTNHQKRTWVVLLDDGGEVSVDIKSVMGNSLTEKTMLEDEPVEFWVKETNDGLQARQVKRLDARYPLYRFASMGPEERWLKSLAGIAEYEDWAYKEAPNGKCSRPVLRSYLLYTFRRLQEETREGKNTIAYGEKQGVKYATFNTGLVTEFHSPIYALFDEKKPDYDGDTCLWRLDDFYKASDEQLHGKFSDLPQPAAYYTDPSVLVYDHISCQLHVSYEHIAKDNINRFPKHIEGNEEKAAYLLATACEKAVGRVAQNYKVAIPQYYNGEVQLLLPICLNDPVKADLALVVSRNGQQYRGDTALPLHQAYNNARLLTRPDKEWLQP
jgi:cold shock CspA family protein